MNIEQSWERYSEEFLTSSELPTGFSTCSSGIYIFMVYLYIPYKKRPSFYSLKKVDIIILYDPVLCSIFYYFCFILSKLRLFAMTISFVLSSPFYASVFYMESGATSFFFFHYLALFIFSHADFRKRAAAARSLR